MDDQDLQQFQKYVEEFSRVAGDRRTSQGLANLVMIQKELGGQKLSPVQLEDDAVYSTNKSGSLGLVRDMKVSLDGATEETFTPLIEGLRRSTLNVRLRNSIGDLVEPLADSLYANQLESMMHQNELHRENVIYYRQMIHAIDNLGKKNQQSFLDSVLVGYRRFVRNPIWTTLSFAVMSFRRAVLGPLWGILTGWKKKSDTEKIIDAIHQQTKFMRTGEIDNMSFVEKFMEKGVIGVIGKSITDSINLVSGKNKATADSPQQQANTLSQEILETNKERNRHMENMIILQKSQLVANQMMQQQTLQMQQNGKAVGTKTVNVLGVMAAIAQSHYEEAAKEQLEEQKKQTEELEEHNRREKRRTLFSVLKTALPGVLGVLGLGALAGGAWYLLPDKATDVIGNAVYSGVSSIWNNMGLSDKFLSITGSLGVMAAVFKSLTLTKGAIGVGLVWSQLKLTEILGEWARGKQGDVPSWAENLPQGVKDFLFGTKEKSPKQLMDESGASSGTGLRFDGRFALTQENQLAALEARRRDLFELADKTGNYRGLESELDSLNSEIKKLTDSIRNSESLGLMNGKVSPIALRSSLEVSGSAGGSKKPKKTSSKSEFMDRYGSMISTIANDLGVDPSFIAGQFALETGWGRSLVGNNNLGNIKAGSSWKGATKRGFDAAEGSNDRYRSYSSEEEFAKDYVRLMKNNYPGIVGAGSDFGAFTGGMQSGRYGAYATDPNYGNKLSKVVQSVPSTNLTGPSISESSVESARRASNISVNGDGDKSVQILSGMWGTLNELLSAIVDREDPLSTPSDKGTSYAAFGE